jgi:hypothetical protein
LCEGRRRKQDREHEACAGGENSVLHGSSPFQMNMNLPAG